MIDRITQEGRLHMVDQQILDIMDKLEGKEVAKNDFKALIYDEEEYFVRVDGVNYPVNKLDCE